MSQYLIIIRYHFVPVSYNPLKNDCLLGIDEVKAMTSLYITYDVLKRNNVSCSLRDVMLLSDHYSIVF